MPLPFNNFLKDDSNLQPNKDDFNILSSSNEVGDKFVLIDPIKNLFEAGHIFTISDETDNASIVSFGNGVSEIFVKDEDDNSLLLEGSFSQINNSFNKLVLPEQEHQPEIIEKIVEIREKPIPGVDGKVGERDKSLCEVKLPKGPKGFEGKQGIQGERGEKGDKGDPGEQGIPGEIGPQGKQGIQGERGVRGEIGSQGKQGIQGKVGTQGPIGLKGPKGEKGSAGKNGKAGKQGTKGQKGDRGKDGTNAFDKTKFQFPLRLDEQENKVYLDTKTLTNILNIQPSEQDFDWAGTRDWLAAAGGAVGIRDKTDGVNDKQMIKSVSDLIFKGTGVTLAQKGKDIEMTISDTGKFTESESAPSGPQDGDRWYVASTGKLFTFVSSQGHWIEF